MNRLPIRVGVVAIATAWALIDGYDVSPRTVAFFVILLAGLSSLALANRLAQGLAAVGLILSIEPILATVMAHMHRIEGAAEIAGMVLAFFRIESGVDAEGVLLVGAGSSVAGMALTWELAALPTMTRLAVAATVVWGARHLGRVLLVVAFVGALRVLALIALIAGGARFSLAWEPMITVLGFTPALFLIGSDMAPERKERTGRSRTAAAVCVLAGLFAGAAAGFVERGNPGHGRVLIDESRSNWEWTDPPFDHERYGQKSLYSYSLWRSWIELHHETRVIGRRLTDEDLAGADILIIKTPTAPYDDETIERIERFVSGGGGLYLIGDHTNLFGMSTVLNAIGAPYGIRFEYDDTFPLDHEGSDIFRPGWLAHPVLRGIAAYPFETSCTLSVPWTAEPMIVGRRLGAEMVDYGHMNFFGDIRLQPSERFGLFVQAAGLRHGRGRVAAFSDSTNFSNFSMLWPGRRELTLNILDWLNRRQTHGIRGWLTGLTVAAALLATRLAWRCDAVVRAACVWLAIAAWSGAHIATAAVGASEMPAARRAHITAVFDTSLGRPGLEEVSPILTRSMDRAWLRFNAFFINAARADIWPVVKRDLVTTFAREDVVVIVNPARRTTPAERRGLSAFLARGGRLLVIDSILNHDSTAGELLGFSGLKPARALVPLDDGLSGAMVPAVNVGGEGRIRRRTLAGGAVAHLVDVGPGRIVLVTDGALFSDTALGGVYVTPDADQREIYRGEEELLRMLLTTHEQ